MNISDQFDRLEKLILDRSTELTTMRSILHSIREQAEADQELVAKMPELKQKIVALETENAHLKALPSRLQPPEGFGSCRVQDQ